MLRTWFRSLLAGNSEKRSLDAAAGGRRWRDDRPGQAVASAIQAGASVVAVRAAHYALNTPEGMRITDSLVGNLVGSGIVPRPQHRSPAVRDVLASEFLAWTDHADADGMTDFYGLQGALVRDMIVRGEGLGMFMSHPLTGAPTIRRLHPEQLDRSKNNLDSPSGARIVQGVEFDAAGRRVAYWLRPSAPGETPAGTFLTFRVPAGSVIHLFRQIVPGQVRGLSWFAPVLLSGKDLDQLIDAMLVRAKVSAMFVGSLSDPDGTTGGFEGDQSGQTLDTTAEPGTIRVEQNGSSLNWSDPPESGDTVAFSKAIHRRIAAGTNTTYEMVSGDYGEVNYSSSRASLLEFRRWAEGVQHHVIVFQLCRPVWDQFVRWKVLAGDISATVYQRETSQFHAVKWMPPAWPWVDPLKDAQAAVLEMDNLIRSRSEVVSERGYDIEALDREIAADDAREKLLGIAPTPAAASAKTEVVNADA